MAKKADRHRPKKHLHGTPNLIIQAEERSILAAVDKSLASSTNSQIIGANGEIPLRSFFNRYLPYTLRVATGHFMTPGGKLSHQLDLMILDSRYPLLSENSDGSVLAMLHAVVGVVECKTRITSAEAKGLWSNASALMELASEIDGYAGDAWGTIGMYGFAYRSNVLLNTLADRFFESSTPEAGHVDLYLLHLPDQDQQDPAQVGALLHLEPPFEEEDTDEFTPTLARLFTPLSDLYYSIIQGSYFCLDARDYSFGDIGRHVMNYMSWSTVRPSQTEPGNTPDTAP